MTAKGIALRTEIMDGRRTDCKTLAEVAEAKLGDKMSHAGWRHGISMEEDCYTNPLRDFAHHGT
jgi:hypothetical protein